MSRLAARILLSLLMLPVAATVAVAVFRELDERTDLDTEQSLLASIGATAVCIAVYWLLLWRSGVRWTPARGVRTVLATAFAVVVGIGTALVFTQLRTDGWEIHLVTLVVGTLLTCGWLAVTVLLWRETAAERAALFGEAGIACPACGYNLTGLSEARCPECGSRFTLEELLADQPRASDGADEL